jgi:hypothetical protein
MKFSLDTLHPNAKEGNDAHFSDPNRDDPSLLMLAESKYLPL